MAGIEDRSNPSGFSNSTNPVPASPQAEQQKTAVNVLVTANQSVSSQAGGKMDTTPGPRG